MTNLIHDSETPAAGQQVMTSCAFMHHSFDGVKKIFLPKRADTKKFLPGVFELPGGHIEYGEDPKDGLVREIKEELHSDIEVGDPFFVFEYTNKVKGSQSFEVVYFAKFTSNINLIALNPEDHSEFGWFAEDELHLATTKSKGLDDVEFVAMRKGFSLLHGKPLNF